MKILNLGAAGQISRMLTDLLLKQTDARIVLYARNAHDRLKVTDDRRKILMDGDFKDGKKLKEAMQDIDIVYINDMGDDQATQTIIEAMTNAGVKRVIAASILGIYDEVPGAFGQWNKEMIGNLPRMQTQIKSARAIENSGLDYTLLRLAWLYNQKENTSYMLTQKGDPFVGTQVTRQAVAKLIVDIITSPDSGFIKQSLGVSEPDTNWDKPSFY